MKKQLLKLSALCLLALVTTAAQAQRYVTEVFPSVNVTPSVTYANNFQVLTGSPVATDLKMDVYEPGGIADPVTARPLIILMHTGSFLPPYINQGATGSRKDSAFVEMCNRFARRGYVVAGMSYRLGWNPAGSDVDIRKGTLLGAVYRGIQDAKCCVRYMRANYATYGVDTTHIILGGQGTGGYIALAYATLDKPSEIQLLKFVSGTTNATYGYTAGAPYINQAVYGDFDGYGGLSFLNNPNNSPNHDNSVQFVFNLGGALGDSSWLEAGDAPMVAFHCVNDPFAPYGNGTVIVPTTGQPVVNVNGSQWIIQRANSLGNNNSFNTAIYNDVFTTRANAINGGQDGLFPLELIDPSLVIPGDPFHGQAGPWEWYDSTVTVVTAQAYGKTQAEAIDIWNKSFLTNPDMSKAKGMAYIDTIMGYLNPRIANSLGLLTGIHKTTLEQKGVSVFPNPSTNNVKLTSSENIATVMIYDAIGNLVREVKSLNTPEYTIDRKGLETGIYLVKTLSATNRQSIQKIILE